MSNPDVWNSCASGPDYINSLLSSYYGQTVPEVLRKVHEEIHPDNYGEALLLIFASGKVPPFTDI